MKIALSPTLAVGICLLFSTGCGTAGTAETAAKPPSNSQAEQPSQTTVSNAAQLSEAESRRPDIEEKLKSDPQSAPENSEYASVDGDRPMEVRVFKSHPKLSRVEKLTRADGTVVKIYYTDGNVVHLPGKMIESLSTISSSEILEIAEPGPRRERRKPPVKQN